VGLVSQQGWHPLKANLLGWLVAVVVSFAGHHRLTFRDRAAPLQASAGRFLLVSAGGFAVNEAAYAVLLAWSGQAYEQVLAVVLLCVAGVTYLLSRHWVFLRSEAR
jgi:putative flippase GtrA